METKVNEICTNTAIKTIFCSNSYYKPNKLFTMRVDDNPFIIIDEGMLF